MRFKSIEVGPMGVNSYVLYDEESRESVIIDPGADAESIIDLVTGLEVTPGEIWLTHGHFDHLGAAKAVSAEYGISIYMHDQDYFFYRNVQKFAAIFSVTVDTPLPEPSFFNMKLACKKIGKFSVDIIHTPGHSPGSVCFFCRENNIIFSGDLIFKFSVGRTDFPGGSFPVLEKSIMENIYTRGESCVIFPGHGPETTVGREKTHNQFVRMR
ncbi:MAG: MBL fold metallo-hydrolase [Oligoflexia bacterium]|nr:MBL fold metallo-hydrolase [Oligoflexia bacterium]